MGSLASQLGALEAFVEQFYPDCPPVTVISLDRRHEQQVPDELLVTDCNDKVVNIRCVSNFMHKKEIAAL